MKRTIATALAAAVLAITGAATADAAQPTYPMWTAVARQCGGIVGPGTTGICKRFPAGNVRCWKVEHKILCKFRPVVIIGQNRLSR